MSDAWARIELRQGDITQIGCDAVVNAANTTLRGGGGVDGAIHRAAGPQLLEECRRLGGCPTGQARITGGYGLPCRHVIHTVGPVYGGGKSGEEELLASCYRTSLRLAVENRVRTIAFPAISCGVYGYPVSEAANIALTTATSFLAQHDEIERVIFVLFGRDVFEAFRRARNELHRS